MFFNNHLYAAQITSQKNVIMGQTIATKEQMIKYLQAHNTVKNSSYVNNFVSILIDEASYEGVRADVAFALIMQETNFLKFNVNLKESQNNYANLGTATFPDVRTGVRAVIQHLKAYASKDNLKKSVVDPRFKYVARGSSPYVEWLGINENPNKKGWSPRKNYGYDIVAKLNEVKAIRYIVPNAKLNNLAINAETYVGKNEDISASALSTNKVLYKFSLLDKATGKITLISDYSENNKVNWTPIKAGKYAVTVYAKDSLSKKSYDGFLSKTIVVKEAVKISKTVVLDAGHGGFDPGSIRYGYYEKNINMQLTEKIAAKLSAAGIKVLYTRQPGNDKYVSLEDRAKYANDMKADLFISIHHDSSDYTSANGTSVHYSSFRPGIETNDAYVIYNGGRYKLLSVAEINDRNGKGFYIDYKGMSKFVSVYSATAYDPSPSEAAKKSANLALNLVKSISSLGLINRGVQDHNLAVTKTTNMPSVLIEGGFISNKAEVTKISNTAFQDKMAGKIAEVVIESLK